MVTSPRDEGATDRQMKANHHQGRHGSPMRSEAHSMPCDQVALPASEDTAIAFCCWLLHFIDLESVVVIEARTVSHAAILDRYLDAVAAEPLDRCGLARCG